MMNEVHRHQRCRQSHGLHGKLARIEQEYNADEHRDRNDHAHHRRALRIDPEHQLRGHRKEEARAQEPRRGRREARPLFAHDPHHEPCAEGRGADDPEGLQNAHHRQNLANAALDEVIVHHQKIKLSDHTNHEQGDRAVDIAIASCYALCPLIIVFCHLSDPPEKVIVL